MEEIKKIQDEIIGEFEMFNDWVEKYEHLIDIGKTLPVLNEKLKTSENIIKGCQSRVWLHAFLKEDKILYEADSDAIMTKGIISLLIRVFSNQKPKDIVNSSLVFIEKIGLSEQLSLTRRNGLLSMIKQMKIYAIAYENK